MKKNLDKEASKRIILNCAREIYLLVTKPKNEEAAYHHADFLLIQTALSLLAYTNDEELHKAVDTIIAGHGFIADRIDVRPYIYATESAYKEANDEPDPDEREEWNKRMAQMNERVEQERAKLKAEYAAKDESTNREETE